MGKCRENLLPIVLKGQRNQELSAPIGIMEATCSASMET